MQTSYCTQKIYEKSEKSKQPLSMRKQSILLRCERSMQQASPGKKKKVKILSH